MAPLRERASPGRCPNMKHRLQRRRRVRTVVVDVAKYSTTVVYDPQTSTAADLMKALKDGQSACEQMGTE